MQLSFPNVDKAIQEVERLHCLVIYQQKLIAHLLVALTENGVISHEVAGSLVEEAGKSAREENRARAEEKAKKRD